MPTRSRTRRTTRQRSADPSQAASDSAQSIWLAGLGALERARTEGPRLFEALVEQGRNMGARAVGAADDVLKTMRQANYSGGTLEKLEKAFQERLAKSLTGMGVMTRRDVDELTRQVRELNRTVRSIVGRRAAKASGRRASAGRSPTAKRSSAKKKRAAARRRPA